MQVAYTNHIGHSSRDTHSGKSTAISSLGDLAATEKHNNHDYTELDVSRMQSNINLELRYLNQHYEISSDGELVKVEGQLDLERNVRQIYNKEFSAAIAEFNKKQEEAGHPERRIVSYIDKISHDKQQEVAVEGLLQIGSLEDWEGKTIADRQAAGPILMRMLEETLAELNRGDGRFVLAGASLHLNEGTPHIHYVGVPIQDAPEATRGLKTRVKKSAVFTKASLGTGLQDNVRTKIEPLIEAAFGWTFIAKKTGRNEDRDKNTQVNEILKEQIRENQAALTEIQKEAEATNTALKKAKSELAVTAQTNQKLQALNASNLKIIEKNDEIIAEQQQIFEENEEILAEQADLIGMYQSHEEYLEGGQKAHKAMDDIQEDLEELPKQAKLFHTKEAESWRQRTIRRLQSMMEFVQYTIGKLQIFEKQYPEEAPEQLSVPAQQRAAALDTVISSAERQAGVERSEQSAVTPEQLKEYFQGKDRFWNEYNQAKELAAAELRQVYHSEAMKNAYRRYKQAQYLVKNSIGIITLGLSLAALIMTKADLKREQQRAEHAKELQQELQSLCRETVNLNVVQREASRRKELTSELESEILEQQRIINDRLNEIRKGQKQTFFSGQSSDDR